MPSVVTSNTATFSDLDAYQEDRAKESKSTVSMPQWPQRIRNKQPLYQDLGIGEERGAFLVAGLARHLAWALCSKDLPKALGNIEIVSNYWRFIHPPVSTEEEKSVSALNYIITEIEIETPERKQITWGQAHMLAFISLRDAEERRCQFAAEEAKRTAIWEEWD